MVSELPRSLLRGIGSEELPNRLERSKLRGMYPVAIQHVTEQRLPASITWTALHFCEPKGDV